MLPSCHGLLLLAGAAAFGRLLKEFVITEEPALAAGVRKPQRHSALFRLPGAPAAKTACRSRCGCEGEQAGHVQDQTRDSKNDNLEITSQELIGWHGVGGMYGEGRACRGVNHKELRSVYNLFTIALKNMSFLK